MDVKTQALDRVLEALSPALAAELDRVVQETREAMQQEFQARLDAAHSEIERAVEQSREDTRREVTAELEKQFAERLDGITAQVRNEGGQQVAQLVDTIAQVKREAADERAKLEAAMTEQKNEWSGELSKVEDERERWRIFAEAQEKFADASSQSEMLTRFLTTAQNFAQGLAIYVAKADGLALWKSKGNGAFPKILSKETTDPESYFKTISVRGKTVCAICASPAFQAQALDYLTGSLERAVESFGLKLRTPVSKQAV